MTETTTKTRKSNAGRKPIADPDKRKQRFLYLTDEEWLQVQHFVSHSLPHFRAARLKEQSETAN